MNQNEIPNAIESVNTVLGIEFDFVPANKHGRCSLSEPRAGSGNSTHLVTLANTLVYYAPTVKKKSPNSIDSRRIRGSICNL